jgi:CRP/FNR family cyclic AMP-dependent transcriptional regulator
MAVVTQQEFRNFLTSSPDAAMHLIQILIRRARGLTENVRNLALMDVYGRIARLLLDLAQEEEGQLVIHESLTQQDIASRVGCSREMVSRIFKDLISGGYIQVKGRRIALMRSLPNRW